MKKHIEPVEVLRAFVAEHGTQTAAAQALGISEPYLSDMLKGNRAVAESTLTKLGLQKLVTIVKVGAR